MNSVIFKMAVEASALAMAVVAAVGPKPTLKVIELVLGLASFAETLSNVVLLAEVALEYQNVAPIGPVLRSLYR